MRARLQVLLVFFALGTTILVAPHSRADGDAAVDARRARVAIKVGKETVTVGELEDRLAGIPPFQQTMWGSSRDEIVKNFANDVVVRDLLLGAGAEQKKLDAEITTQTQKNRALSTATLRALKRGTPSPAAIPMEDVQKYYDENRSHFDSPERIQIWRILVASQAEADAVLAAAKREPTVAKFNELAREKSIDKATNLRGGNLGFIAPDGSSNEAGLKVDIALVKAVQSVKDGEFVAQAIPEGGNFAVVWRRGTVPATKRSVEEASAQIRATLYRERTEGAEKKLIDELRAKKVTGYNADPLKIIEIPALLDAGLTLPRSVPSLRPSSK